MAALLHPAVAAVDFRSDRLNQAITAIEAISPDGVRSALHYGRASAPRRRGQRQCAPCCLVRTLGALAGQAVPASICRPAHAAPATTIQQRWQRAGASPCVNQRRTGRARPIAPQAFLLSPGLLLL